MWQELRAENRAALIPYVTAGFPDRAATLELLHAIDGVADLIELGVPFSDPVADGEVIQRTSFQALAQGMSLQAALDLLREAQLQTPVVLFSYLNPVLSFGVDRLLTELNQLGVAGLLLTDLPAGNDPALEAAVHRSGVALIPLVAPTTSSERVQAIGEAATGFLYLVARLGVTGVSAALSDDLEDSIARVREAAGKPVVVGFGISTPAQAATVAAQADGVVVGSALMSLLESRGVAAAADWLKTLRKAMIRK